MKDKTSPDAIGKRLAFFPPANWSVVPLRYLFDSIGGATPSKDREEYWRGEIPWVSPKDMKSDLIQDSEDHISDVALRETRFALLRPASVLIVVRGMILVHTIPVAPHNPGCFDNTSRHNQSGHEGTGPKERYVA